MEMSQRVWVSCQHNVYQILSDPGGVKRLLDEGLPVDILGDVVAKAVQYYQSSRVVDRSGYTVARQSQPSLGPLTLSKR